jgi:hypothetical protein
VLFVELFVPIKTTKKILFGAKNVDEIDTKLTIFKVKSRGIIRYRKCLGMHFTDSIPNYAFLILFSFSIVSQVSGIITFCIVNFDPQKFH